jgi:NAD dependent epimerase/dehydratase family enzyme
VKTIRITRTGSSKWPFVGVHDRQWHQITGAEGFPDCDAVVQLTGEPIFGRHIVPDRAYEDLQYHSRGGITELIAHHVKRTKWPPRVFVQASNVGIYPARYVLTNPIYFVVLQLVSDLILYRIPTQ